MSAAALRFGDVRVGDEIPPLAKVVTREDVKAYADASGDQNPLHQSDELARAVGFPGIIAHGMFTMAHLVSCLVAWLGEPAGLLRIRVRFRSAVFMGETIVAGGIVRALDRKTRTATLDVWVTLERDGVIEYPIKRSEAEVRLA
ncbi:MAG: MaoC/PaaZ C-terminal domain-containing protein [Actinomycetota bacterium]